MSKAWIPNMFNILRIILTPVVVYLIITNSHLLFVGIVFVLVACTDMLDGVMARHLKVASEKGARLDQIADRIFFTSVGLALLVKILIITYPGTKISDLYVFFLLLSREIIALPAFLYLLIMGKPFIKVRWIGKITTVMQAIVIAALIIELPLQYAMYLAVILGFFGILSGLTYWYDVANARVWKAKKKYREVKEKAREKYRKVRGRVKMRRESKRREREARKQ